MPVADTTHLAYINALAANNNQYLKGTQMARNLINAFYGGNYFTPAAVPPGDNSQRMLEISNKQSADTIVTTKRSHAMKVYPNPANNFITFEVDGGNAQTEVTVFNLYGQKLYKGTVMPGIPLVTDTQEWVNGFYMWRAVQQNDCLGQGKFEIIK